MLSEAAIKNVKSGREKWLTEKNIIFSKVHVDKINIVDAPLQGIHYLQYLQL